MKKIFLAMFSVFMLMSGIFITACCEKSVTLSIDTENVTIYTNSQNQDNVLSKDVTVSVSNSSAGIGKIVESGGENTIHLSATRRHNDNTYSFTIYGDKSGSARVRVWAIDNINEYKVINVKVNTVLEKIETSQSDSTQGRTNRFIVKGDGNEINLNAEEFFDLKPLTANVKDIEWTFTNGELDENGQPVMYEDSVEVARISNGKLWVSENAQMEKINLRASFVDNKDITNTVELDVLENSTINSLEIGDNTHTVLFYSDNAVQDIKDDDAVFNLKRNDANRAVASGTIVINTQYNVQLSPIFYASTSNGMERIEDYLDYFTFNVTSRETQAKMVTYTFEVNATDYFNNNTSGSFMLQLNIGYADYAYDITTSSIRPIITTSYAVEGVNLFDAQQDFINNDSIDIFSNYNAGGYTIRTILLPDDGVTLDNNLFNIKINIEQSTSLLNHFMKNDQKISSIVKFTRRGEEIKFTNSSEMEYTSTTLLQSGDVITLIASDNIEGSLENVVFEFVPQSDPYKKTQIGLNLYRITSGQDLEIVTDNDMPVETQYIASNEGSTKVVDYTLKILGLTSASGLVLKNDNNPRFIFPEEDYFTKTPEAVETHISDGENDPDYIIVQFSVRLNGTNIDSKANFWFEHITQKTSQNFSVEAFMPIDDVSILNADPLSTNVYYSKNLRQGFSLVGDEIQSSDLTSVSLAKIMLEAGSILTLSTTFQSLANDVEYGFITLDQVIEKLGENDAENIFRYAGEDDALFGDQTALDYLATQFSKDEIWTGFTNYFGITTNRLTLSDNEFKGFVFAKFNGFDSAHREVVAVRIFALESFYAVKSLSSNVRDTILYTTETLSQADMARASVNVTLSFRNDGKTPTYTHDQSMFTFESSSGDWEENDSQAIKQNRFYTISNIDTPLDGRYFTFTITANSTKHQTRVYDILTITYRDEFGFERKIDISLEIRNVNRVEQVEWVNKTLSGDVYLNLTSSQENARKFMIKTAVLPSGPDGANDKTLRARYASSGDGVNLSVTEVETIDGGQNFNLSITGTDRGGVGNLYILPNDMIKRVDGIDQVLIYKYEYDENGQLKEEKISYIRLDRFENYYDEIIAGSDNYSNYFYNNDNERIYYSDVILNIPIIMADGQEIETAVRVYSEEDLKKIDKALKYRVMNNITLSGWQAYDQITENGAIFGDNDSIVLNFTNDSQNFVDTLRGQIFDLVLTGDVTVANGAYAGFIARENYGTISNVRVDVNYNSKDSKYVPSSLTYNAIGDYAGGLVGNNMGTITNSYTYGMSIVATNSTFVGGLVGSNSGRLANCGVEFYTFAANTYNTIAVGNNCNFGGLVGQVASADSVIYRDYIYAYPFTESNGGTYSQLVLNNTDNVSMFVGATGENVSNTIEECFGFMGDLNKIVSGTATFVNSYYVKNKNSEGSSKDKTMIFLTDGEDINGTEYNSNNLEGTYKETLDRDIWELDNIDNSVNFDMIYLKNNVQSAVLDINKVNFKSQSDKIVSVDGNNAFLFYYQPQATISDPAERSELTTLNTVSLTDIFDIKASEQKSLIISSVSQSLVVNATSLRITNIENSVVKIKAHSKMDLTQTKEFNVVITYALPTLTTLLGGYELSDNEVVRLQTSKSATDEKISTIVHELDHTIMLNGNAYASVAQNSLYQIAYVIYDVETGNKLYKCDNIGFAKSELSLIMTGKKVTQTPVSVQTFVELKNIAKDMDADTTEKYNNAIREKLTRKFQVSVFNGATNLLITNAKKLNFSPVDHATFDVDITTDNEDDNLVFTLEIGGHTFQSDHLSEARSFDFVIDSTNDLHLSVIWTPNTEKTKYSVSVFVPYVERYKVVQEYDFSLSVNALSQIDNDMYVNTVDLKLVPEYVNSINIDIYNIQTRRSVNNTMYYTQSSNKTNSIIPSSDAILTVHMTPEFALATHFTLTYTVENSSQPNAAVQIMKLTENQNFGLYLNSAGTSSLGNGLRVNISDADRQGKGYYYFRVYASNIFKDNSTIVFTTTFYNGEDELYTASEKLGIDFMQDAQITIDGQAVSSYLIAKSTSTEIEVTVGKNQTVMLSLQNNGAGISLVLGDDREEGNFRIYKATVVARANAKVMGDNGQQQSTGVFYVRAGVSRVIDGVPDIKYTSVKMNLLDFTIDPQGISVRGSHNTTTYNQSTYDAFYVYRGAPNPLEFDYTLLPQTYDIDESNPEEVDAIKEIEAEKEKFLLNNYYEKEGSSYHINYTYDVTTNKYTELTLKEQLAYARNEYDTESIYNPVTDGINRNDLFTIERKNITKDGKQIEQLVFTGLNTGKQLMRLETLVWYDDQLIARIPYFFVVVVDTYYDEENPVAITSQEDLERFADPNRTDAKAEDYILMNDIVLENYTPLSTAMFNSLDGNGYVIHLNSFAKPSVEDGSFSLAMFSEVTANTTLKNICVNIYQGGQLKVNVSRNTGYSTVNVAGFALVNNGIIYNCEVVAYKSDYQTVTVANPGLNVVYTNGENDTEIQLNENMGIEESFVAGFVIENNLSIVNSRVGGENFEHIVNIAGVDYIETLDLDYFNIRGQVNVAGFIANNYGKISASYADNVAIYNMMDSNAAETAGFALYNTSSIEESYVEGAGGGRDGDEIVITHSLTKINVKGGFVAGFIYDNSGVVKNSYANIAIENTSYKPSYLAGFVYRNNPGALVTLCFTACEIQNIDAQQRPFSGVSGDDSLNEGTISYSYYYSRSSDSVTDESRYTTGITPVSDLTVDPENLLYGFSFTSGNGQSNGIWEKTDFGIVLVNPNKIAISNRYMVVVNDTEQFIYNTAVRDVSTLLPVDLSYGSEKNPIIIRSASDFVLAMGKAQSREISSYLQYYSSTEVWGNYRFVNDVVFDDTIEQNPQTIEQTEGRYNLTTTSKTFRGNLTGNGFTLSGLRLSSSQQAENYGLFAKLDSADIINLNLEVEYVNSDASVVGILAGTAIDSNIISVSVVPYGIQDEIRVNGENVVGGLVGMLFGESKVQDVSISNIYVESADYEVKNITSNKENIGRLRDLIKNRQSIANQTTRLSYTGAVIGFVDTYSIMNNSTVKFETSIRVKDFDVLNVHVTGFVNIYGEVAGGLFGYVGDSTKVYDASLKIDADAARSTNPSYIIAKNLYAGGLVGENYGGLFAVYAQYSDDIQNAIEAGENSYYMNGANVERGQDSIFSYTEADREFADIETKYDDPLAIGGLVGYMGAGYIYVGYSKLNVITRSDKTMAIGGIVGMLSSSGIVTKVESVQGTPNVNVVLNDVYASGDVHFDTSNNAGKNSAGIVGAITDASSSTMPTIVLRNVMAMNYLGVANNQLIGDTAGFTDAETSINSTNHFMLIGNLFKYSNGLLSNVDMLNTDIYIVRDDASYVNLNRYPDDGVSDGIHNTVGGYNNLSLGQGDQARHIQIKPFAFNFNVSGDPNTVVMRDLVVAVHIGESDMQSATPGDLSTPSIYFKSYFLERGWESQYWIHDGNKLFPEIELLPRSNVVTWDVYNTEEVIDKVSKNKEITIVLRGKLYNQENSNDYTDIDIRKGATQGNVPMADLYDDLQEAFRNFKGTLISYYQMEHRDDCALNKEANEFGGKPDPEKRVDPGLIVDAPLITATEPLTGLNINGINFYFCKSDNQETINYALLGNAPVSNNSVLRNVSLIYNDPVAIEASENGNVGLVTTSTITSTSVINTTIVVREKANSTGPNITLGSGDSYAKFVGLIAGKIIMDSQNDSASVSGLSITKETANNTTGSSEDDDAKKVKVEIKTNPTADSTAEQNLDVFVGLFAGQIYKTQGASKTLNLGFNQLNDLKVTITAAGETKGFEGNLYVGGFVGQLSDADRIVFEGASSGETNGFTMVIDSSVSKNLYAGGVFGQVASGSDVHISVDGNSNLVYTNNLYLNSEKTISGEANIGGIIGETGINVFISNLKTRFGLGTSTKKSVDRSAFETFKYDDYLPKNDNNDVNLLNPFVVKNANIGGMIGKVSGGITQILRTSTVDGSIDVAINGEGTVNVGGYIGDAYGDVIVNAPNAKNSLNISVYQKDNNQDMANIGGIVGRFNQGSGSPLNNITINDGASDGQWTNYTGIVLAAVKTINFGGAVGFMNKQDFSTASTFNNVAFGGALEVWDNGTIAGGTVQVGGVIGAYDQQTNSEPDETPSTGHDTITNARTYGDVFVNYKMYDNGTYLNNKLATYYFGGIVGYAVNVSVENCSTIMTSFNSRLSTGNTAGSNIGVYGVNAIVGADNGQVTYKNNKYSSGVMMTYQVEENNKDCYYGDQDDSSYEYYGYTNKTTESVSTDNNDKILKDFQSFVSGCQKLNPVKLSAITIKVEDNEGDDLQTKGDFIKTYTSTSSSNSTELNSYHNISWLYVGGDLSLSSLGSNITDIVIVGNGHTVTVTDNGAYTDELFKGALVDTMGAFASTNDVDEGENGFEAKIPNFTAITGMKLNLKVEKADVNITEGNTNNPSYGGVTGVTNGNSFIYGVGVTGQLSVGGANVEGYSLRLGGIVGTMKFGMIDECYMDATVSYRGNVGGFLSGIANTDQYNTTIKNTYSSGLLETFADVNIYTLAYSEQDSSAATSNDIMDVYSISQIKVTNLLENNTSSSTEIYFVNTDAFSQFGQHLNGTAAVTTNYTAIGQMALAYSEANKTAQSYSIKTPKYDGNGSKLEVDDGDKTPTPWYFSPYVNYGYASHGFGYLKNVTTYTETDGVYSQVSYDVLTTTNYQDGWYLGVPNVGKFEQMVDTVKEEYESNYKFLLKYNIDMSKKADSLTFGQNIGAKDKGFVFDGDGHTLDFAMAGTLNAPLFGDVTGEIKNLRLADISTSGNDGVATLAKTMNGSLNNITAIGSVTSGASVVGGVVATLNSSADKIQSLVNITKTGGGIVGGIAGVLNNATISNSSNSGQIVSTGSGTTGLTFKTMDTETKTTTVEGEETVVKREGTANSQKNGEDKSLGNIAGGVVGYANGGTVKNSYNANAVLSGFTDSTTGNYLAGGVVGYASGTTINSSYNTGLVGAGNYGDTETYALAGGIFGYGVNITLGKADGNDVGCINDGAVQAINQVNENNYSIKFELNEKNQGKETYLDTDGFDQRPSPLVYNVTMTYNAGSDRKVYAFGLGYSYGGSISDSQSSIDNIKNDGNIGQYIDDTKTMTFDRETWMDDNTEYEAKFAVQNGSNIGEDGNGQSYSIGDVVGDVGGKFYVNGRDNYGFPARIYLTDTMTRRLNYEATKRFYNMVKVQMEYTRQKKKQIFGFTFTKSSIWDYDSESGKWAWTGAKWGEVREGRGLGDVKDIFDYIRDSGYNYFGVASKDDKNYYSFNSDTTIGYYTDQLYRNYNNDVPKTMQGYFEGQSKYYYSPQNNNFESDKSLVLDDNGNPDLDERGNPQVKLNYDAIHESEIYNFQSDTTFYASTEFSEYNEILRKIDLISNETNITNEANKYPIKQESSEDSGSIVNIEAEIQKIDQKLQKTEEQSVKEMTVNGKKVAIIENNFNMKAVYTPYYATFEQKVKIPEDPDTVLTAPALTKNNFEITVEGCADGVGLSYYVIQDPIKNEDGTYTIKGTLYFNDDPGNNCKCVINVTYDTPITSVQLRKNDVQYLDNELKINLDRYMEDFENRGFDKQNISEVALFDGEQCVYIKSIEDNDKQQGKRLNPNWEGNNTLVIDDFSGSLGDATDLRISFIVTTSIEVSVYRLDLKINNISSSDEIKVSLVDLPQKPTDLTFIEEGEELTKEQINDLIKLTENREGEALVGLSYDLSNLVLQANGKLAFGDENYNFNYTTKDSWKNTLQPEDDNLTLNFEGNTLKVSGSEEDLNKFKETFQAFTSYRRTEGPIKPNDFTGNSDPNSSSSDQGVDLGDFASLREHFKLAGDEAWNRASMDWNDFDNQLASTQVSRKPYASYFGLDFYEVDAKFTYELTSLQLTFNSSQLYKGFTLKVGDKYVRQGTTSDYISEPINLFDHVDRANLGSNEVSLTVNDVEFAQTEFSIGSYLALSGNGYQYSVTKNTTETCPVCGKDESVITTYCYKTDDSNENVEYSYTYRLFACGDICVYYTRNVEDGDDNVVESGLESVLFTYNHDNGEIKRIDGEWIWYVEPSENDKGEGDFEYNKEGVSQDKSFDKYFSGYTFENGGSISVDLVVSDFGDKTVNVDGSFAYNGFISVAYSSKNVEYTFSGYEKGSKPQDEIFNADVVYYGYQEKATITVAEGETLNWKDAASDGEFEKAIPEDGKYVFEADSYDLKQITYYKHVEISSTGSNYLEIQATVSNNNSTNGIMLLGEDKNITFPIVLLNSDIVLSEGLGSNKRTIVGNNFNIKFNGLNAELIETNEEDIRDVNFVGQASLSEQTKERNLLIQKNYTADITSVKLYGNMRNIYAENSNTVSSSIEYNETALVATYVAMTGLDAGLNKDVAVTLVEKSSQAGGGIVVAGSAIKSEDGANGSSYSSSKTGEGRNGGEGNPGKQGGSVAVSNTKFARVGAGSMSGYGGNGANGSFYIIQYSTGGGGGGMTHNVGNSGASEGDNINNASNLSTAAQYGGNGGVGGLGRVFVEERYLGVGRTLKSGMCFAGKPGAAGGLDTPGNAGETLETCWFESTTEGYRVCDLFNIGECISLPEGDNPDGIKNYKEALNYAFERRNEWYEKTLTTPSKHNDMKLYCSCEVHFEVKQNNTRPKITPTTAQTWGKVSVWCSGEYINSGGSFNDWSIKS